MDIRKIGIINKKKAKPTKYITIPQEWGNAEEYVNVTIKDSETLIVKKVKE